MVRTKGSCSMITNKKNYSSSVTIKKIFVLLIKKLNI